MDFDCICMHVHHRCFCVQERGEQPTYRCTNKTAPDRIRLLDALGFQWKVPKPDAAEKKARAVRKAQEQAQLRAERKAEKRRQTIAKNDEKARLRQEAKERAQQERSEAKAAERAAKVCFCVP